MLKILTVPNPILLQKSRPISAADINSEKIQKLISEMTVTMIKKDGVGLAAPQIGESIRLIIIQHQDGPIAMINPKIIKKSLIKEWGEEGCLSLPDMYGEVKRCKKITVKYINNKGKEKQIIGQGLLARVIQHENDHLDGALFIDKARKVVNIKDL